jgi:hypothetical protein
MQTRVRFPVHSLRVARPGLGVDEGVDLDAPSSLDGIPAGSSLREGPLPAAVRR